MFSLAFAQEATQVPAPSITSNLIFFGVFFIIIYFFVLRPHFKKSKEDKQMRDSLRIGDKVVTTAGVFGSVIEIDEAKGVISLEISKGASMVIYKHSIAEILNQKNEIQAEKSSKK